MHAIITTLSLAKPIDDDLLSKIKGDLYPRARENPGFVDLQWIKTSDTEAIILVFFSSLEALDEVSSTIAGPWFAENVRPYLAGPVKRSVGEVMWRGSDG